MHIEFHNTGNALMGQERMAPGAPVPRVGEWIHSPAYFADAGGLNFLVYEVYYVLEADALEAVVCARATSDKDDDAPGNRLLELHAQGWLDPLS